MELFTLKEYCALLAEQGLIEGGLPEEAVLNRTVELVSCDSQNVVPGTLFLVKGAHFKAEYLRSAQEKGAFCYLSEREFEGVDIPCIRLNDVRRAMALLATRYYNDPWSRLDVVGITGTKGKSSTTYYVKAILDDWQKAVGGEESGVVSSIDTYDGEERFESHLTTPEPLELERHFYHAAEHGLKQMTMEVSSQALKYDRVLNVNFSVACFLNIGYDHISPIEHPDWEDYFTSKLRIFEQCSTACVNLDSDELPRILEAAGKAGKLITFSQTDASADVYGYDVRKLDEEISFRVRTDRFDREFRLSMPGMFNVQNALAAIAICSALGVPEKYMYTGLLRARVPGRMEVYSNANHRVVAIVDYAHNRLSFEKLFQSVREEYAGRRIVIIFGCPGKKALDRRHDLGEIAGKYADFVYLTEEDAGEEPVEDICREIAVAVAAQNCSYSIEPDRGKAIHNAVMECESDTVILITGKGAETRQKRGTAYIDCPSDVEYAKDALHDYDLAHHMDGLTQVLGLLQMLPRLQACDGKVIVVKYGGSALAPGGAVDSILEDVAALRLTGAKVVLVHGGGKNISSWLKALNIESHFEQGYRVTDDATMDVVEMALSGQVNKHVVADLHRLGVNAVGVSGRDGNLIRAQQKTLPGVELGHVGTIASVDPKLIYALLDSGFTPVISPVAEDENGSAYNINADDAACAVAQALKAEKLVYLTDVDGILMDKDNEKTLLQQLTVTRAEELLEAGMMSGGMVPKLKSCIEAIRAGVHRVVILDGRVEHTILLEAVSSQMMGTVIIPDGEK